MSRDEKEQEQNLKFDSRMVEWNMKHNLVTRDQLKSYLQSLPDESGNCENLQIEEE